MSIVRQKRKISTWMLVACGLWLAALGLYFIFLRPALLPEDTRFMGMPLAEIQMHAPGLEIWLKKVFSVMGGFMVSAGVLTVFVGTVAMPRELKGTAWVVALSGLFSVGLMAATNFGIHSDFRWTLLAPAVAWLLAFAFYMARR